MSRYKLHHYEIRCDRCRVVTAALGTSQYGANLPLPAGWQRVETRCHGSDHYYDDGAGWQRVETRCHGSDHYYKDGYSCVQEWCPACSQEGES